MISALLLLQEANIVQGEHVMNRRQKGTFTRQTALLLALLGSVVAFAIPKLNDFSDRGKVTEAYHLASESKLRLNEFYMLSGRFPSTETEIRSVTNSVFNQPDYVRAIVVENESGHYDVVVKVYLESDAIDREHDSESFIFMAGTRPVTQGFGIEWQCGASNVENHLLPRDCSS
jgi:hypothetical protein